MSFPLSQHIRKTLHGSSMQRTEINELIISRLWHGASWTQIKDLLLCYEVYSKERSMLRAIFSRSIMALLSSNKFSHILQEKELLYYLTLEDLRILRNDYMHGKIHPELLKQMEGVDLQLDQVSHPSFDFTETLDLFRRESKLLEDLSKSRLDYITIARCSKFSQPVDAKFIGDKYQILVSYADGVRSLTICAYVIRGYFCMIVRKRE